MSSSFFNAPKVSEARSQSLNPRILNSALLTVILLQPLKDERQPAEDLMDYPPTRLAPTLPSLPVNATLIQQCAASHYSSRGETSLLLSWV